MIKIKSHYNLRKFDLPESFNQSDVMIEVPFEYGIINIFPYYNSIEIVETKRELPSLFVTFKGGIEELAFKTLDSLTREDLLNCAFQKSEAIPCCQAIKYVFKDLFYKRYLFNNHEYKMLHFQSAKFFIRLTENGNGNLNLHYYKTTDKVTYKDIEDFINLVKLNITNLEVIPN